MGNLKKNKIAAITLALVLFITLVRLPLPAKERRGATVKVIMTDGSLVKGELLAVKTDVLLLYDQNSRQGKSLDLQQVVQVKILNKTKVGEGVLIGLGVSVGLSALYWVISKGHNKEDALLYLYLGTPKTALFGGLLGALAGIDKKFSLAGESFERFQQNLEQLKRYARERDVIKLAAE